MAAPVAVVGAADALSSSVAATILRELWTEMYTQEFALRCTISCAIAALLYTAFGYFFHTLFPRKVPRDTYTLWAWSDLAGGYASVLFGTPVLQIFIVCHQKWNISYAYTDITQYGWGYWALSIPLYLLAWDLVFYVLHLVLHIPAVYEFSHKWHHAFRPPTAWAGIAVDPLETILSGLAPFLVPFFFMPMHLYTAYAINILLEGWATMLHSSCAWEPGWLLVGPLDHNQHHAMGRVNGNYAAIFTLWDRLFGTLLRDTTPLDKQPYWIKDERKAREEKAKGGKKGE